MPLIRYKIGDTGVLSDKICSCGMQLPLLKEVTGRSVDRIVKPDGTAVSPLYFIHLVGVVLNRGEILKFQVIQEDVDSLRILIVPSRKIDDVLLNDIKEKVLLVMSPSCQVHIELVDDIATAASGKYRYIISKVKTD